jgi:hypothetical protein
MVITIEPARHCQDVRFFVAGSPTTLTSTEIRCFQQGCHGVVKSSIKPKEGEFAGTVLNEKTKG